jgi:prevent-host-death family protein
MQSITASEAKNKFGQLLEMAQAEPIRILKNGRDVAVMLSPEDFKRLLDNKSNVNPVVIKLHEKSMSRWAKVYEALAK